MGTTIDRLFDISDPASDKNDLRHPERGDRRTVLLSRTASGLSWHGTGPEEERVPDPGY